MEHVRARKCKHTRRLPGGRLMWPGGRRARGTLGTRHSMYDVSVP
jgi:hypothetical protein